MDAVKFLRERNRMCKAYKWSSYEPSTDKDIEKHVAEVEQWSKEHPQKTLKDDFLEKYPNAILGEDGTPYACTRHLGYRNTDCEYESSCADCWNQPLEDCV